MLSLSLFLSVYPLSPSLSPSVHLSLPPFSLGLPACLSPPPSLYSVFICQSSLPLFLPLFFSFVGLSFRTYPCLSQSFSSPSHPISLSPCLLPNTLILHLLQSFTSLGIIKILFTVTKLSYFPSFFLRFDPYLSLPPPIFALLPNP